MPGRLSQASGFRQQGKHNRTSGAERSEIRREAVRPPPLQDAAPCPGLAHPGFHSKSSFVCFPVPSHQPMKIHRIIPEEPEKWPLQECSGSFSLSGIKVQSTQMEEDVRLETLFVPIAKGFFDQPLDFIV